MLRLDFKPMLNVIKQKRESLEYSQGYMAAKLQISQNTYSKMELGITQMTIDRFWQICEILTLDIRELLSLVKASVSKEELVRYQLDSWQR